MALWQRLYNHPQFSKIQSLYTDQFPVEVRFTCADWIEEQMAAEQCFDLNDPQIEQRATDFVTALRNQLLQKIEVCQRQEDMSIKFRLQQAVNTVLAYNNYNVFATYKKIRETLQIERQFVDTYNESMSVDTLIDSEAIEIDKILGQLLQSTKTIKERSDQFVDTVENYSSYVCTEMPRTMQLINAAGAPLGDPKADMKRNELIVNCERQKLEMEQTINNLLTILYQNISSFVIVQIDGVLQKVIVDRLGQWQQNQVLSGNGAPLAKSSLDDIQKWFEQLFDAIWLTRSIIVKIRAINAKHQLNHATLFDTSLSDITILLQRLIVSGFIVEKQPPQVMKTNTRYVCVCVCG